MTPIQKIYNHYKVLAQVKQVRNPKDLTTIFNYGAFDAKGNAIISFGANNITRAKEKAQRIAGTAYIAEVRMCRPYVAEPALGQPQWDENNKYLWVQVFSV